MSDEAVGGPAADADPVDPVRIVGKTKLVYRHPIVVRAFHWINALSFLILLATGLQIFNNHPRLYWGETGWFNTRSLFAIAGDEDLNSARSWIAINDKPVLETTGVLGRVYELEWGKYRLAYPKELELVPNSANLDVARGWHFLFLYIFSFNLLFYMIWGVATGRFKRTLIPKKRELAPRAIWADIVHHLQFKRETGAKATRYNFLQKAAYLIVLFVLLPVMIMTGMAMSPTAMSRFPVILDLFGGAQSARTIHFICAHLLLLFVLVHLLQVFVAGVINQVASMMTGWFELKERTDEKAR